MKPEKRFAAIALGLTFLMVIPISLAYILKNRVLLIVAVLFLHWAIPLIAAFWIEKRSAHSLGVFLQKNKIINFLFYAFAGFVLLYILHGGEHFLLTNIAPESEKDLMNQRNFFTGLLIRLAFVVLPEEFFYRGFLQTRLCEWLGNLKGLLLASLE